MNYPRSQQNQSFTFVPRILIPLMMLNFLLILFAFPALAEKPTVAPTAQPTPRGKSPSADRDANAVGALLRENPNQNSGQPNAEAKQQLQQIQQQLEYYKNNPSGQPSN